VADRASRAREYSTRIRLGESILTRIGYEGVNPTRHVVFKDGTAIAKLKAGHWELCPASRVSVRGLCCWVSPVLDGTQTRVLQMLDGYVTRAGNAS
jgi:hypothetical protein